ncbi:pyruvate kinase alpha/beta domain-containing protein [Chloroflexota bacterium]
MIESRTVYFSKVGLINTDQVLRIAKKRADELGINTILVASTEGTTAVKAVQIFEGKKVVAVTHHAGYKEPDALEWTEANKDKFEQMGGVRLTSIHAFYGLSRAIRKKWNTYLAEELVANTLRLFGEGMKVVCEIVVMAADAGMVSTEEDVISIAGTARGADTAVVLRPVNLFNFFDLRVKEVLCKPHF